MTSKTDVDRKRTRGAFADTVLVLVNALVIAFLFKIFFFQSFHIPSGSMKPTLLVGDYVFISKLSYGYSKYSFPFTPDIFERFGGRVLASAPKRGDVVVFHYGNTDYIKRLIGMPGDRVQMRSGVLYLNGKPVITKRVDDFITLRKSGKARRIPRYEEILPDGTRYSVLDIHPNGSGDDTPEFVVPSGHFFFMGDNRDNSNDSRFSAPIGFVPFENLIGKAKLRYFSHTGNGFLWRIWEWPGHVRWNRLFTWVN